MSCLQVGLNIDTPRVAITMIDMTLSVFTRNVQLVFMWQITWKFLCIIFVLLPLWNCIYVALGFCFRVAITMIDMTLSVFTWNVQLVFMWQITWKFLCIIFVLLPLWNCIYVALGFCFKFFSSIVVKSCIYCVFVLLKCCLNKKGGTFPHLDSYFQIGQSLVTKLVVVLSYNLT